MQRVSPGAVRVQETTDRRGPARSGVRPVEGPRLRATLHRAQGRGLRWQSLVAMLCDQIGDILLLSLIIIIRFIYRAPSNPTDAIVQLALQRMKLK